MEVLSMCRICMTENVLLRHIVNTHLQELYETISLNLLETKDDRPLQICYICYARLQNCYKLRKTCLQSEELFTQMLSRRQLLSVKFTEELSNHLRMTAVVHLSVGDEPQKSRTTDVKVETPDEPNDNTIKYEVFEEESPTTNPEVLGDEYFRECNEDVIVKQELPDVEISMEVDSEEELVPPSTSQPDINERQLEFPKVDDDLRNIDDSSASDNDIDDLDFDLNPPLRNVTEPALESDLTVYETRILQEEDKQNDLAIRELVPKSRSVTNINFEWTKDRKVFKGLRETFTGTSGPTFKITDQTRIVDVFYKMIDIDFVDRICKETNLYATQKIKLVKQKNKYYHSRLRQWYPTDRSEVINFLALTILQDLYPLSEEKSYFFFNGFGSTPLFCKIMSYDRYILLKTMIHFVNNNSLTDLNKLCKIGPVIDYFNDRFASLYYPSQDIVLNESLLKRPGKLGFTERVLCRAANIGIIYELFEVSTGYLWKFHVQTGHDKTLIDIDDITDSPKNQTTGNIEDYPKNTSSKILYDLIKPLLHRGHTLIADNVYSCPLLARCLKWRKTDYYGTIRLNREFLPDSLDNFEQTDLQQRELVASYCQDVSVCVRRDGKVRSMISTYHTLECETWQELNKKTYMPSVFWDYYKTMDSVDQFLSAQPAECVRNKTSYKNLFRRLFNHAIYNSFIIFKSGNEISYRQFRRKLAEDLLKIHRHIDLSTGPRIFPLWKEQKGITSPDPKVTSKRPNLKERHFPVKHGIKQSYCLMCAQKQKSTKTAWKCFECKVNLCVGCFMQFHS